MRVTCIIPTRGDRPEFVQQALKQLDRQTRKPDDIKIIESDKGVTGNVRAGYEGIKNGIVCIIEDDDKYPPNYIERVVKEWDNEYQLLGFDQTMYYHLFRKEYSVLRHPGRSSLFQTTIKAGLKINWPSDYENFLDLHLWGNLSGKLIHDYLAIGLKHNIGKTGGRAHSDSFRYQFKDTDGEVFKQITKGDEFYQQLVQQAGH